MRRGDFFSSDRSSCRNPQVSTRIGSGKSLSHRSIDIFLTMTGVFRVSDMSNDVNFIIRLLRMTADVM
jgi:hypothetical protein